MAASALERLALNLRPVEKVERVARVIEAKRSSLSMELEDEDDTSWGLDNPDYGESARQAYRYVGAVRRSVDIIKGAVAKLPLRFYVGEGPDKVEVEREPGNIVDLWRTANPRESYYDVTEQLVASLKLVGNAYLFLEGADVNALSGFVTLPGHLVEPVAKKGTRELSHYKFWWAGKEQRLSPEQVVHVREYTEGGSLRGVSPIEAATLAYKSARMSQKWVQEVLGRGGEWTGALRQTGSTMDPGKRRRLELQLAKRHSGAAARRRPLVLPKDVDITKTMLTPKEMMLLELYAASKADIYELFGIPPWRWGSDKGGSALSAGSGSSAQERIFYEDTVQPECLRLQIALTENLLHRIDPALSCEFDLSGVYALQEAFLSKAKAVKEAVGKAVMSPNEGREFLGLERTDNPDDDELQKQQNPFAPPEDGEEPKPGEKPKPGDAKPTSKEVEPEEELTPDEEKKARRSHPKLGTREHLEIEARVMRGQKRLERMAKPYVVRLFDRQEERVLARLKVRAGLASVDAARVIDIADLLVEDGGDSAVTREMLEELVATQGEDALYALVKKMDFKLTTGTAAAYMQRRLLRALTDVTETTRELLTTGLSEGIAAGGGLEELVGIVRGVFADRRDNAVSIARTEAASAFNFATVEAMRQSEVVKGKRWVAVMDEFTRESHAEMDGAVVALDGAFDVGGQSAEFPGDPGLSADESVNCRCGVEWVLSDEKVSEEVLSFLRRALKQGAGPARARVALNGKAR